MADHPSVLIVDNLEETREVLQTALQRRGVRTFAASQVRQGLELARQYRPDLIVLDLEFNNFDPEDFAASQTAQPPDSPPRLVLLGTFRRSATEAPLSEFLAKPYHYAALVRKIEELLDKSPSTAARCA